MTGWTRAAGWPRLAPLLAPWPRPHLLGSSDCLRVSSCVLLTGRRSQIYFSVLTARSRRDHTHQNFLIKSAIYCRQCTLHQVTHSAPYTRAQSPIKNWGCPMSISPSCPYKRPTTAVKGVEWMNREGVSISSRLGGLAERVSSPSGVWGRAPAAKDFGVIRVRFYAISCFFLCI